MSARPVAYSLRPTRSGGRPCRPTAGSRSLRCGSPPTRPRSIPVHEAWRRSGDSHASVVSGLAVTARVISSAALIMMSVFFAFLLADSVVIKMLALGLGVSVLIDATLIRLVIVPSAMFLLGNRCWWLPAWLDRALPRLEPASPARRPAPSFGAASASPSRSHGEGLSG
ncbi:MMPL family transporter [Saccharomonospora sp. NPDC006951]